MGAGGWRVHRYDLERSWPELPDVLGGRAADLSDWVRRLGGRHGQRFLLGPNGFPDLRINAFLASARMRNLADTTNRDYAQSLTLWLNFLHARGHQWWAADVDDVRSLSSGALLILRTHR